MRRGLGTSQVGTVRSGGREGQELPTSRLCSAVFCLAKHTSWAPTNLAFEGLDLSSNELII